MTAATTPSRAEFLRLADTARVIPVWTDEAGDGRFRWRSADPALDP